MRPHKLEKGEKKILFSYSSSCRMNHGLKIIAVGHLESPRPSAIARLASDEVKVVVYRRLTEDPKRRDMLHQMEYAKSLMDRSGESLWEIKRKHRIRYYPKHEPYIPVNKKPKERMLKALSMKVRLTTKSKTLEDLIRKRTEKEEGHTNLRLQQIRFIRRGPGTEFKLREREIGKLGLHKM